MHTTTPDLPAVPELRYHRLGVARPEWWRPIALLGFSTVTYLGLLVVVVIAVMCLGVALPSVGAELDAWSGVDSLATDTPLTLALMLGMLALLVPACRLGARWSGRPGGLDSVAGRIRWGLLLRAMALPAALMVVTMPFSMPDHIEPSPHLRGLLLVAVLLVPLQAAGEEYLFRGVLPQVLGRWLRAPFWGAVVSIPLFTLGHGYNLWGQLCIAVFAAAACYLVWRTGGLEVVIGWHVVNNLFAFLVDFLGMVDPEAPIRWQDAAIELVMTAVTVVGYELLWRRRWSRDHADRSVPVGAVAVGCAPLP